MEYFLLGILLGYLIYLVVLKINKLKLEIDKETKEKKQKEHDHWINKLMAERETLLFCREL